MEKEKNLIETFGDISKKKLINKRCITFSIILLVILLIKIVTMLLIKNIPSFAMFYTKYILNIKNGIIYSIFPCIPLADKLSERFQLIIFLLFILGSIFLCIGLCDQPGRITKKRLKQKKKYTNLAFVLMTIAVYMFVYDTIQYYQIESIPNMEKTLYKKYQEKEYTTEDVDKLMNYLDQKLVEYSEKTYENKDKIKYEEQAKEDLNKVKDKIPYITGLYPSKIYSYDKKSKETYGASLTGLTDHYIVSYNDYLPASISLNTVTHEFCHTKSISRENEAVYCSYVAGINSNNDLSKYAAYIEAYSRIAFAYSTFDLEKSIEYEDKYTSKCLIENKEEFCYVYGKNNKEFIKGSKYIWLKTYSLKNYANYKDELIKSLKDLTEHGYHLKLEIEDRNIKIEEVSDLINNGSNDRIVIQKSIDSKGFASIKDSIANDKLYLAVMQMEDNDSSFTHGDALNYYLGKYEEDEYVDMYTYSRIIRLLLIYHDINGYN